MYSGKIIALSAICFLILIAQTAAETSRTEYMRSAQEEFTDKMTGLSFAPNIAGFRKTEVRVRSNQMIGTVARYAAASGATADIYIYSLAPEPQKQISAEDLEKEYLRSRDAVINLAGHSGIKSVTLDSEKSGKNYRLAEFIIVFADNKPQFTSAVVSGKGKYILKLRITGAPGDSKACLEAFRSEFIKLYAAEQK